MPVAVAPVHFARVFVFLFVSRGLATPPASARRVVPLPLFCSRGIYRAFTPLPVPAWLRLSVSVALGAAPSLSILSPWFVRFVLGRVLLCPVSLVIFPRGVIPLCAVSLTVSLRVRCPVCCAVRFCWGQWCLCAPSSLSLLYHGPVCLVAVSLHGCPCCLSSVWALSCLWS